MFEYSYFLSFILCGIVNFSLIIITIIIIIITTTTIIIIVTIIVAIIIIIIIIIIDDHHHQFLTPVKFTNKRLFLSSVSCQIHYSPMVSVQVILYIVRSLGLSIFLLSFESCM